MSLGLGLQSLLLAWIDEETVNERNAAWTCGLSLESKILIILYHQICMVWSIIDLNVQAKITKLLKKNNIRKSSQLLIGLDRTQSMKHKTKIVQLEFIEIKYLCPSKTPLGKQKKPTIEQKKIFTKMSDKRMYKERTPILNNKSKQFKKWTETL